jgi:uridine kinase
MIKIFCVNTQTTKTFNEGVTLQEILPEFDFPKPYPIIAAKVNNVCQGLKYRAFNSRQVEFLDYTSYVGRGVYCRSLCFLLCKATKDLFPGSKLIVRRPISKGYFCSLSKGDGTPVTPEDVINIKEKMAQLVEKDIPFRRWEVQAEEAIETFRQAGYDDKVKLLQSTSEVYVNYYTLEDTVDYYYDALLPSTGYLNVWELSQYKNGMLLRVPNRHSPEALAPFTEQPRHSRYSRRISDGTKSWGWTMPVM